MEKIDIISKLSEDFDLPAPKPGTAGMELLAEAINNLLNNNFQKLISILYRMDINEKKLRRVIEENPDQNAGWIIAELMIERELQKIKSRQEMKSADDPADGEDKW